ncbi:putative lipopolysaccharide biosynthesis O-acetyl transferase WbbJ [Sphingobacterium mizutaii NBRC 14946 = DSM 11724]|uniref:Acetyltransferase SACOL2570 n=2 Tax=Sphingobacterium mizutaii TaxID=1010 RepID=A0AAJ5C237_9SPHI|nr:acetyltransferase [Sphingobacterium mizutaii]GEM66500.1 putative lipopolysaccharide biosynthesis O-acetyl transferase WbbJ [Sphingobacterium mizutaii NBRC 14946 = DSM 11724]SDL52866.1 lipopolysaccharide O-acetyltransferase [Sphingobacterium mizutaii]SNV62717.1 Putative acetyltransferase SACOL2570 [Sphingobacterium mizutaii]
MKPKTYEPLGYIRLIIFKIRSYFLFKNSRIIRFPFYIRGRRYIKVGNNLTTGYNCRLDAFPFKNDINLIEIGNDVQINDYVHIASIESVKIGNNVLIASKVFITDHNHGNYSGDNQDSPLVTPNSRPIISKPVIIEDNVWLGEQVCVLPGVKIGRGTIIGTMSVVTKDIPPFSIAIGIPAKVIKTYSFDSGKWENINK